MLKELLKLFNTEFYQAVVEEPFRFAPNFVNEGYGKLSAGAYRLAAMASELAVPTFVGVTAYSMLPAVRDTAKAAFSSLSFGAAKELFTSTAQLKTAGLTIAAAGLGIAAAYHVLRSADESALSVRDEFLNDDYLEEGKGLKGRIGAFVKNFVYNTTTSESRALRSDNNGAVNGVEAASTATTAKPTNNINRHYFGTARTYETPFSSVSDFALVGGKVATTVLACKAFAQALPLILGKGDVMTASYAVVVAGVASAANRVLPSALDAIFDTNYSRSR